MDCKLDANDIDTDGHDIMEEQNVFHPGYYEMDCKLNGNDIDTDGPDIMKEHNVFHPSYYESLHPVKSAQPVVSLCNSKGMASNSNGDGPLLKHKHKKSDDVNNSHCKVKTAVLRNDSNAGIQPKCPALPTFLCYLYTETDIYKLRRLFDVRDNICNYFIDKQIITVGSVAEGHSFLPKSSIDVCLILKWIHVNYACPKAHVDNSFASLDIELNATFPGYVSLKVKSGLDYELISKSTVEIKTTKYLSGDLFKMYMKEQCEVNIKDFLFFDPDGTFKFMYALKLCSSQEILKSLSRKFCGWDTKNMESILQPLPILLVPKGHPWSSKQNIQWLMIFPLHEKALIRHFNHIQLLTLWLLKSYVKCNFFDAVSKGSLSYLVKTVMFWVVENTDRSIWTISNFMKNLSACWKRLVNCMESDTLPNFFIPEQNVLDICDNLQFFKRQIRDIEPTEDNLWHTVHQQMCERDFAFAIQSPRARPTLKLADLDIVSFLPLLQTECVSDSLKRLLENKWTLTSRRICSFTRCLYLYCFAQRCQIASHEITVSEGNNKSNYKNIRFKRFLLLMGSKTDSVSGWIVLAFHLLQCGQIGSCLKVLEHIEERLKDHWLLHIGRMTYPLHHEEPQRFITQNKKFSLIRKLRLFSMQPVLVTKESNLFPPETFRTTTEEFYYIHSEILFYYLKFLSMIESDKVTLCPEILIHAQEAANKYTETDEMQTSSKTLLEIMEKTLHRYL